MSSMNLEGLEIKEATPSIAPSIYENQYNKKWRILLALGIGISLMGLSILIFYVSARSYRLPDGFVPNEDVAVKLIDEDHSQWRTLGDGLCISSQQDKCPSDMNTKPVIIIALGGLRPDQALEIPALRELSKCGVEARSLVPSYPSYSYPNLYSLATGLYPESHGIVSNKMFDADLHSNFTVGDPNSHIFEWGKGDPIWNTLARENKKTGIYLWPGFDPQYHDTQSTHFADEKYLFKARMKKIMEWIKYPEGERPNLIMMYYDDYESVAQKIGPNASSQIKVVLNRINLGIDELMNSLSKEKLVNCVDIIVVSDHGMAQSTCQNTIDINELLEDNFHSTIFSGSVGTLQLPKNTDGKVLQNVIQRLRCKRQNLRVLEKSQVPKRYHYTNNKRIGELVLDSTIPSYIYRGKQQDCNPGLSGYDNLEETMQGMFVAQGPSFKKGVKTSSFRNIEIYNLICSIIGIRPSSNNGTVGSLDRLMTSSEGKDSVILPEKIFLEEKWKPRPRRPNDGVLDEISDGTKCQCDRSHLTVPTEPSTTTMESTTFTTSTTPATTSTPSTTSTTSTPSTTETTSVSSTTSTTEKTTTPPSTTASSSKESSSTTEATSSSSHSGEEINNAPSGSSKSDQLDNNRTIHFPDDKNSGNVSHEPSDQNTTSHPSIIAIKAEKRKKRNASDGVVVLADDDAKAMSDLRDHHCPMGCPKYFAPEVASDVVNILHQSHYIIGFPESLNLGIWVSYTITSSYMDELHKLCSRPPKDILLNPEDLRNDVTKGCWVADPRSSRTSSDQCARSLQTELYKSKNVTLRQLYPEELEDTNHLATEGFFLTNMAPLLWGYVEGGRNAILQAIDIWVPKFNAVNVQHGPIFDFNFDGRKDNITVIRNTQKPLIPSDYFFVVTFCNSTNTADIKDGISLSQCSIEDRIVLSFTFPNLNVRDQCLMTDKEYLRYHLANLGDVEDLSGIRFFPNINDKDYAQLRSIQPLSTFT